jgi:predicted RNA-binding protein YlxR (DUF448 family)
VATPDELVRVVRTPDGALRIGRTLPGRGAWLCRASPECLEHAMRKNAFGRALRMPVSAAAVVELSKALAGVCEDRELHLAVKRRD